MKEISVAYPTQITMLKTYCLIRKIEAILSFWESGVTHPKTRRHTSEDFKHQQHRCKNLKSRKMAKIFYWTQNQYL